ncbi:hypothetical protein LZ32DRAFT_612281 [Colletotrichum eremochloae]|nr:hypothetical protein LZ32DRAFT_612281 [Colletotrichum eremochloae]
MSMFPLYHFAAVVFLIASLVAGEAAFYVSASAREALEAPSPTYEVSDTPRTRPPHSEFLTVEPTTRTVETSAPRTRALYITPLEEQARVCNLEAEHSPHDPIDSRKQGKGVSAFCDLLRGKGGYLEPGMESQRVEFQDANGGRHHYKVEWAAECQTEVESQAIRRPLGHVSASLNCHDLMRDNYLKCNNGGVGGKVQVGCLIYTYNGGIMPGRVYDW